MALIKDEPKRDDSRYPYNDEVTLRTGLPTTPWRILDKAESPSRTVAWFVEQIRMATNEQSLLDFGKMRYDELTKFSGAERDYIRQVYDDQENTIRDAMTSIARVQVNKDGSKYITYVDGSGAYEPRPKEYPGPRIPQVVTEPGVRYGGGGYGYRINDRGQPETYGRPPWEVDTTPGVINSRTMTATEVTKRAGQSYPRPEASDLQRYNEEMIRRALYPTPEESPYGQLQKLAAWIVRCCKCSRDKAATHTLELEMCCDPWALAPRRLATL